jgi:hypothetical protein
MGGNDIVAPLAERFELSTVRMVVRRLGVIATPGSGVGRVQAE